MTGGNGQRVLLDRLRAGGRGVVIFGAGIYAYVLYRYLEGNGVRVSAFVVDAAYKHHDSFMDRPLLALEQAVINRADDHVVIGMADYRAAVAELGARGLHNVHVVDVPDCLNIPRSFMDRSFVEERIESFDRVYDLWDDDLSRQTYIAAINAKISEDVAHVRPFVRRDHLYFSTTEFPVHHNETLLDVGGFTGDSIIDFNRITGGRFRRIVSLEPFAASFEQLLGTIEALGDSRIVPLKIGAWDVKSSLSFTTEALNIDNRILPGGAETIDVDTIDALLAGRDEPISLIKMDINGAEFRALSGARETIRADRPRIAVKLHVKDDFIRLPLLLHEMAPQVKLFLRQRNYMSMMLVMYASFA